jgi:tetratricopeptide (TPR) repeat protein
VRRGPTSGATIDLITLNKEGVFQAGGELLPRDGATMVNKHYARSGSWMAVLLVACWVVFAPRAGLGRPQAANASGQAQEAALMEQAQRLVEQKDYAGAERLYEKVLQAHPESFEALNNMGVAQSRRGNYLQAAKTYERALRLKPKSFPLLLNLGLCYFKAEDFKSAAKPLAQAVTLQPENFQARSLLAMSYYSQKQFEPASREFEKLIAVEPDNTTLQFLLAQSYLWSKQNQKMLDYFAELEKRSPNSASVHMLMGEANDGLGRTANAIKEFEAAAALAPAEPNVHFGLGYLYWQNHEDDKAAEQFKLEIQNGGAVEKSEAYLGDLALRAGKFDEAQGLLQRAVRGFSKIRIAHYDLGILYARKKLYDRAIDELHQAIALDPTQTDAHFRLAQVYRAQGKLKESQAELAKMTEMQGKSREDLLHEISGSSGDKANP